MKIVSSHAFTLLLAGLSLSHAQDGTTRTISVISAQGSAGGSFSDPVLNGSGVVSFTLYTTDLATADTIYKTSGTSLLTVASTSQLAQGLSGNFVNFSAPLLNENGTVAFSAGSTGGTATGIYTGSGGAVTMIAKTGQSALPLGGNISAFSSNMALSDSGSVAFYGATTGATTSGFGDFVGSGGALTALATTLQTAPGTNAAFGFLSISPVLNNTGGAAFMEQNVSAGTAGIYTTFGNTLTTVATTLQAAPEIGGNFASFGSNAAINDNGTVAFSGSNGLIFSSSSRGIFARVGGVLTVIASTTRLAPGLSGNFTKFTEPALSNSGIVAFRGEAGVSGQPSFGQGIYTGRGGTLVTITKTGDSAPGLGGTFSHFGTASDPSSPGIKPAINDLGTVAFLGTSSTSASGIYLGDGQQLVTVAYTGQSLAGSTISSLSFSGGTDRGSSSQFNNNGQLAYKAAFANGTTAIELFTPTLHFRSASSGAWTTRSNWTLGLLPASVHDVIIDPAAALAITGPMLPTTVRSLALNGSGANVAELILQSTGTLTAPSGASTGLSGRLSGNGRLNADLISAGTIAPGLLSSAGSISVTGNVTLQSTAHLAFDLGGLTRKTGYDFFGVTGLLTLGGSLDVSLLGGFAPQAGNSFDLFDSTTVAGNFASIHLPTLTGGLTWNTTQLPTTGVITVAGLTVTPTTYTLAASASTATIHAGGSSTITATITNTGAASADTLNYTGLSVLASPAGGAVTGSALANSSLANNNTQSGTATFSSTTGGTYTLTPTLASALNGTLGTVAANGGVTTASVTVFSGSAKWNAAATAAWSAGAGTNWTDTTAASVHASPGTFADFATSDTAVFDGSSLGSIVNLDGAAPSLAALSFTGHSCTIAKGTGGALTLNNGASAATVTDSGGSHSITAPVQLGGNAIATVTNPDDTLTLSGDITGAGKTLTRTGAGTLLLSGAQNYTTLNANGGVTDITGSFTGGTATVHANATVRFEASQTLAALFIGDGVAVTLGSGAGAAFGDATVKADLALVPEPGSASLLLPAALGLLSRRRRARR